jgi:myo-inositol-1(or 4)-monophosphatase
MVKRPESFWADVRAAIKSASGYLKEEFEHFDRQNIEFKGLHDLVSFADRNSEGMLKEALMGLDSTIGFWGEESGAEGASKGIYWLVDPLDGTTNFMHGIPHFAISVALVNSGMVLAGFVKDVMQGDLFEAQQGLGARCNGKPIHTSRCVQLEHALIATGFPVNQFELANQIGGLVPKVMRHTRGLRRFGSAALDLVHVSNGRYEAFYEFGLKPWDVAAGAIIVQEAGGHVTDLNGTENWLQGPSILASASKPLHHQVIQLLEFD